MDLKQDLRCDTIDTREEYEMKVGKGIKAGHKGNGIGGCRGRRGQPGGRGYQEACR